MGSETLTLSQTIMEASKKGFSRDIYQCQGFFGAAPTLSTLKNIVAWIIHLGSFELMGNGDWCQGSSLVWARDRRTQLCTCKRDVINHYYHNPNPNHKRVINLGPKTLTLLQLLPKRSKGSYFAGTIIGCAMQKK